MHIEKKFPDLFQQAITDANLSEATALYNDWINTLTSWMNRENALSLLDVRQHQLDLLADCYENALEELATKLPHMFGDIR